MNCKTGAFGDRREVQSEKVNSFQRNLSGNEAAALWEVAIFRAEIDDGGRFWPRRRKAPSQLGELVMLTHAANDGRRLGRPNVAARFHVWRGLRKPHWNAKLAKRLNVSAVANSVAVSLHILPMCQKDYQHATGHLSILLLS